MESIIFKEKDGLKYIQFKKLLEYKDKITHAYCIGTDVNFKTVGDNIENALKDYEKLCKVVELDVNNLVKADQKHTKNVEIVTQTRGYPDIENEKYKKTDGLITDKKNVVLATTNADCIILLFYDPVKDVIADVHSGWKGTLQQISIETVKRMEKEYNCNPKDIICCMCPSIRKCHFEVEKDVKDMFYKEFKDLKEIDEIIQEGKTKEKWNIDTILINRVILKKEGLKEENIIDSGLCSVCNCDKMHSFRGEGEKYGLNTAIISKI